MVPTDRWYIERTVWLIAGVVLLAGTALAALVHPLWVLAVIVAAWSSIAVSLTGFCLVGNVLYRLGFSPRLAAPSQSRPRFYRMQTDRWYLERRIYLVVGINLTVASMLSLVHTAWWLAFPPLVHAVWNGNLTEGAGTARIGASWLGRFEVTYDLATERIRIGRPSPIMSRQ